MSEVKPVDQTADIDEMRRTRKLYVISFNVAIPAWLLSRIVSILPEDAKLVGADRDFMNGNNRLCFWSDSFPEGDIACAVPELLTNVTVNEKREIERVFLTKWNREKGAFEEVGWR